MEKEKGQLLEKSKGFDQMKEELDALKKEIFELNNSLDGERHQHLIDI